MTTKHTETIPLTSMLVQDIYHKMVEEVEDYAILMIDTNGTIINWNKGAQKIKGYTEQEILGKNFRLFYTRKDQENKLPEKLLSLASAEGKAHHEGWRVRKDGATFWGSIVITAIHANTGEVIGFSKVTRDLTERKLAEDKVKQQAAELAKVNQDLSLAKKQLEDHVQELSRVNKDLEQFAFVASHDLQEPLRKISSFLTMLLEKNKGQFDAQSQDLVKKILTSTGRMRTLIKDLLILSSITEGTELLPVDLNKVVSEVVEELEIKIAEKKAVLEVDNLPAIKGVESYVRQLFFNLISNALKFSIRPPVIRITFVRAEDKIILKVQDNGIGIQEEYFQKIFEAFKRVHSRQQFEGTGIGLALCKRIVEVHKGVIEVESKMGEGTTFSITLYAAE